MADTLNITATFGPVQGDRTTLSHSCRKTLDTIYQHPMSHNLEWADVVALFAKLGSVEHKPNNEFVLAIDGDRQLLRKGHGKDLHTDDVVQVRHMLTRAGWSPETGKEAMSAIVPTAEKADRPDMLVAIEHHEARIYQLDISAASQADHTIRPYDPHHFLHHLSHKDQSHEHGQREAEDPSFYVRIAEAVRPAGRIVVVSNGHGHSNAGHHLIDYLRQQHKDIFQKVSPLIDADLSAATPPQLLALGRHALSAEAAGGKAD